MKTKKVSYPPFNIATSFMLVIFIILCMVIFAVLSLSSTVKDHHLSQTNAARTTAYYEANNRAEELLAEIDGILASSNSIEQAIETLQTIDSVSVTEQESCFLITYTIPIDDSEILEVSLETTGEASDNLIIRNWRSHSANEWSGDTSLPVLGIK